MQRYFVISVILFSATVSAQELTLAPWMTLRYNGELGAEAWYFPRTAPLESHPDNVNTAHGRLDLTWQFDAPLELRFNQRFQYDFENSDRNRYEIEDLYLDWFMPRFELRAGYQIFSWKTVESASHADFLNQTDLESDFLDADKLSELALRARFIPATQVEQVLEFYYFARHRSTRLPVGDNRFSFAGPVLNASDTYLYQADAGALRPQLALSYSRTVWDKIETRLFYFNGYNRFPGLLPVVSPDWRPAGPLSPDDGIYFRQEYRLVHKVGLTFQGELDAWLVKGELVHTNYQKELFNQLLQRVRPKFLAYTVGFERTFYSVLADNQDVGAILEVIGDTDTGKDAAELESFRPFRNHLFGGLRYTFSNISDRSLLFGGFFDYREGDWLFQVEYDERLTEVFKIKLTYTDLVADTAPLSQFGHTDRFIAELSYHF